MTNPVLKVRGEGRYGRPHPEILGCGVWVWCPGCNEAHRFRIPREDGSNDFRPGTAMWSWNGDEEKPTFSPSHLVTWDQGQEPNLVHHVCHSFLRDGRWEFLSDSTHHLAGQTVDMVPLPDWLAK